MDITYKGGGTEAIGIIGKGVMFDTGGISIKPSRNMKEMKGDMGGAAAVVAAAGCGSIEIETKCILYCSDCRKYGVSGCPAPRRCCGCQQWHQCRNYQYGCRGTINTGGCIGLCVKEKLACMLDIATLTGASIIALGPYAISVMGNHQGVVDQLLAASMTYNERCWQLPLFDEYQELLRSDVADVLNANEGVKLEPLAAKFLEQFVGDVPWAHLDIASTMSVSATKGDQVKGMTGAGTRALISFLLQYRAK